MLSADDEMATAPLVAVGGTASEAQKSREVQAKLSTLIKKAQFALTLNTNQSYVTALVESATALMTLSSYLTLSGSPIKAAALSIQLARIIKAVVAHLPSNEHGSRHQHRGHHSSGGHRSASGASNGSSSAPGTPMSTATPDEYASQSSGAADLSAMAASATGEPMTGAHGVEGIPPLPPTSPPNRPQIELEATLRQLQSTVAALTQERDDLLATTQSLQQQLVEAERQARSMSEALHTANEAAMQSKAAMETLRGQVQSLTAERDRGQQALKDVQGALTDAQQICRSPAVTSGVYNRVSSMSGRDDGPAGNPAGYVPREDYDALETQNKSLATMLQSAQAEMSSLLQSKRVPDAETLQELEADHQQQLEAMRLTIRDQYERETKLTRSNEELQQTIKELKKQIEQISTEPQLALSSTPRSVQNASEVNDLHTINAQLKETVTTLQNENTQLAAENTELQEGMAATKETAVEYARRVRLAEQRVNAMKKETVRRALMYDDERKQQNIALEQLRQQLATQRARADKAESAMSSCASDGQKRIGELERTLEEERKQQNIALEQLRQQLATQRARADKAESAMSSCASDGQKRIGELERILDAERGAQQGLREALDKSNADQQNAVERAAQLQQQLVAVQQAFAEARCTLERQVADESDRYRRAAAERDALRASQATLQLRLTELEEKMQQATSPLMNRVNDQSQLPTRDAPNRVPPAHTSGVSPSTSGNAADLAAMRVQVEQYRSTIHTLELSNTALQQSVDALTRALTDREQSRVPPQDELVQRGNKDAAEPSDLAPGAATKSGQIVVTAAATAAATNNARLPASDDLVTSPARHENVDSSVSQTTAVGCPQSLSFASQALLTRCAALSSRLLYLTHTIECSTQGMGSGDYEYAYSNPRSARQERHRQRHDSVLDSARAVLGSLNAVAESTAAAVAQCQVAERRLRALLRLQHVVLDKLEHGCLTHHGASSHGEDAGDAVAVTLTELDVPLLRACATLSSKIALAEQQISGAPRQEQRGGDPVMASGNISGKTSSAIRPGHAVAANGHDGGGIARDVKVDAASLATPASYENKPRVEADATAIPQVMQARHPEQHHSPHKPPRRTVRASRSDTESDEAADGRPSFADTPALSETDWRERPVGSARQNAQGEATQSAVADGEATRDWRMLALDLHDQRWV